MHLFRRSHNDPVPVPSSFTLPPELWGLVCSFLPGEEVCRLRSLNSSFLAAALAIHYGTLTLKSDKRLFRSWLTGKFLFDVLRGRPYSRQYTLDHVRTLCLVNGAENAPFYTSKNKTFGSRNGSDFGIVFAANFSPRLVQEQLGHLHNVQTLRVEGQPFSPKSFCGNLFYRVSGTLVHLELDLVHLEGLDLSTSLGDTVLCPNLRSLKLLVDDPDNTIPLIEQGIQRIRSLVPSDIESLELYGHLHVDPSSSSMSLAFFNQLKKLRCASVMCGTARLPFAIPELINTNAGTLVDIQVDLTTLPVEYYEELNWSEEVHTLSLSGLAFYQKRHIYLPRLEKCENLRQFSLEGNLSDDDTVDLEAFHESLLMALSKSATQLNELEIPFRTISLQRVWDIACTFPNLDSLSFNGVPDPQDIKPFCPALRAHFVGLGAPQIFFFNLQTRLSEIRRMGPCSDFQDEHATALVEALTGFTALCN